MDSKRSPPTPPVAASVPLAGNINASGNAPPVASSRAAASSNPSGNASESAWQKMKKKPWEDVLAYLLLIGLGAGLIVGFAIFSTVGVTTAILIGAGVVFAPLLLAGLLYGLVKSFLAIKEFFTKNPVVAFGLVGIAALLAFTFALPLAPLAAFAIGAISLLFFLGLGAFVKLKSTDKKIHTKEILIGVLSAAVVLALTMGLFIAPLLPAAMMLLPGVFGIAILSLGAGLLPFLLYAVVKHPAISFTILAVAALVAAVIFLPGLLALSPFLALVLPFALPMAFAAGMLAFGLFFLLGQYLRADKPRTFIEKLSLFIAIGAPLGLAFALFIVPLLPAAALFLPGVAGVVALGVLAGLAPLALFGLWTLGKALWKRPALLAGLTGVVLLALAIVLPLLFFPALLGAAAFLIPMIGVGALLLLGVIFSSLYNSSKKWADRTYKERLPYLLAIGLVLGISMALLGPLMGIAILPGLAGAILLGGIVTLALPLLFGLWEVAKATWERIKKSIDTIRNVMAAVCFLAALALPIIMFALFPGVALVLLSVLALPLLGWLGLALKTKPLTTTQKTLLMVGLGAVLAVGLFMFLPVITSLIVLGIVAALPVVIFGLYKFFTAVAALATSIQKHAVQIFSVLGIGAMATLAVMGPIWLVALGPAALPVALALGALALTGFILLGLFIKSKGPKPELTVGDKLTMLLCVGVVAGLAAGFMATLTLGFIIGAALPLALGVLYGVGKFLNGVRKAIADNPLLTAVVISGLAALAIMLFAPIILPMAIALSVASSLVGLIIGGLFQYNKGKRPSPAQRQARIKNPLAISAGVGLAGFATLLFIVTFPLGLIFGSICLTATLMVGWLFQPSGRAGRAGPQGPAIDESLANDNLEEIELSEQASEQAAEQELAEDENLNNEADPELVQDEPSPQAEHPPSWGGESVSKPPAKNVASIKELKEAAPQQPSTAEFGDGKVGPGEGATNARAEGQTADQTENARAEGQAAAGQTDTKGTHAQIPDDTKAQTSADEFSQEGIENPHKDDKDSGKSSDGDSEENSSTQSSPAEIKAQTSADEFSEEGIENPHKDDEEDENEESSPTPEETNGTMEAEESKQAGHATAAGSNAGVKEEVEVGAAAEAEGKGAVSESGTVASTKTQAGDEDTNSTATTDEPKAEAGEGAEGEEGEEAEAASGSGTTSTATQTGEGDTNSTAVADKPAVKPDQAKQVGEVKQLDPKDEKSALDPLLIFKGTKGLDNEHGIEEAVKLQSLAQPAAEAGGEIETGETETTSQEGVSNKATAAADSSEQPGAEQEPGQAQTTSQAEEPSTTDSQPGSQEGVSNKATAAADSSEQPGAEQEPGQAQTTSQAEEPSTTDSQPGSQEGVSNEATASEQPGADADEQPGAEQGPGQAQTTSQAEEPSTTDSQPGSQEGESNTAQPAAKTEAAVYSPASWQAKSISTQPDRIAVQQQPANEETPEGHAPQQSLTASR